jgi:lipoprotein-anchoring transpeptidase ErfK/SrfK
MKEYRKLLQTIFLAALPLLFTGACQLPFNQSGDSDLAPRINGERNEKENSAAVPTVEIESFSKGNDAYKVVKSGANKIAVNAPGASEVSLFYQPVTASDRSIKLKTITTASNNSRFETELQIPEDFNGEIWARAVYPGGQIKQSERQRIFAGSPDEAIKEQNSNSNIAANTKSAADDNESARSDNKTGGRIEKTSLAAGNPHVRITVNVPAFTLTLWQDGKEVKSFYVGVGRKNYPIPTGMRSAEKIILNPDWIPPDSEWVRDSGIEPYERIPADDPDNPLGKIKIPLGDAYLLHEAQGTSDIGNLVSHGCVRVLRDDIFELTRLIAAARDLSITNKEISEARKNSERRVIELGGEIPVDINYDTMVVEGGILHIYPDVYEQKTNTVEELRAELESYKIDVSKFDDSTLKKILDSVSSERKFVIPLDDLRNGQSFKNGRLEPLTPYQANKSGKKDQ